MLDRADLPRCALRDPADPQPAVAMVSSPAALGAGGRRRGQPHRRGRAAMVRVRPAPAAAGRGRRHAGLPDHPDPQRQPGVPQLAERWRPWLGRQSATPRAPRLGHQIFAGCLAALVAIESYPVIKNLAGHHQAMNRSYDRLALVNTYGAFGSVGMERHEIVIEGTRDPDPATAQWSEYELRCKPGDIARRPCMLGPYHLRLDWLIWFAAMYEKPHDPWVLHVVWKLLDGDRGVRQLFAVDPFDGAPPRYIRIQRFAYHLAPYRSPTWWTRDHEEPWLPPVSLDTPGLRDTLERFGMPSPTLR
ncbi:MAG: lipase maturation factor family protein [Deltaproteobacteria bacterium]|nr:MAG: lipase maturation factor family protein [Deltaproteobacteria bacterium]